MPSVQAWARTAPAAGGGRAPHGPGSRAPAILPGRARRRPALMAAGATLAALGGLAGMWLVNTAGHREPVLVVARPVAVGSVIQDADLAVAQVYVDASVARVPAAARAGLVGKVATSNLTVGALLAPGQVSDSTGVPAPGQVLAVVTVPANRIPAVGLRTGDVIRVVSTPVEQADPRASVSPPSSIPATVVRVSGPDASSVVSVDVLVADADGDPLAALAATGRIAIVLQPHPDR